MEKKTRTNFDVSSQQYSLLRKGKLLNRRNFLLRKYWQKRSASLEPWVWEPETALIRAAGLLEVQPEDLQTGVMGRSHPSSHFRPSQSLLPPVWGAYVPCMSHPFLMFGTELTSKTATARILWGCSSITIPKHLRMSPIVVIFCFSSFFFSFVTLLPLQWYQNK